jgi:phosphocarrier protein HPr
MQKEHLIMSMSEQVFEQSVIIGSKSGLHARPASIIVQKAKEFPCQIDFIKAAKTVNAKSLLAVLTLGAENGDQIIIRANGEKADQALAALVPLLEENLG